LLCLFLTLLSAPLEEPDAPGGANEDLAILVGADGCVEAATLDKEALDAVDSTLEATNEVAVDLALESAVVATLGPVDATGTLGPGFGVALGPVDAVVALALGSLVDGGGQDLAS